MKNFLLSALFTILLCTCKKDDQDCLPGLPCATQVGANTFGCYINGEPWVAEIASGIFDPSLRNLDMLYDETGTGMYYGNNWRLAAHKVSESVYDAFVFTARKFDSPLSLDRENNKIRVWYGTDQQLFKEYWLDTLQQYKIEITKLDTINNICSGKFEFFAISNNKSDTLHITEGRFDKKYNPE
ncbi:MAG: hypothetical protein Q7T20_07345 [Saprospiraceae bacterium]|nr:hypothetical protein [Saprospiraceae bacterium]